MKKRILQTLSLILQTLAINLSTQSKEKICVQPTFDKILLHAQCPPKLTLLAFIIMAVSMGFIEGN